MNPNPNVTAKLDALRADYETQLQDVRGELQEQVEVNAVLVDMVRAQQFEEHYGTFPFLLLGLGVLAGIAGHALMKRWTT
jgi:hypothetical protein